MRKDSETIINSGSGYLRATTVVEVVDIWGQESYRKVVIGKLHSISLHEAADIVEKARQTAADRGQSIQAEFKISL